MSDISRFDLPQIKNWLDHISFLAEDDPESAHASEDELYARVLLEISEFCYNPHWQRMANTALESKSIQFPRWSA